MKERPILFSAPMVRAIIAGEKTQTRRVVKSIGSHHLVELKADQGDPTGYADNLPLYSGVFNDPLSYGYPCFDDGAPALLGQWLNLCPYGKLGDRLWVRETFSIEHCVEHDQDPPWSDGRPTKHSDSVDGPRWLQAHYRASDPNPELTCERDNCRQCADHEFGPHWRPSIHMPRWASRILLEITNVRVERLKAISEADAQAEGCFFTDYGRECGHRGGWRDVGDCRAAEGTHPQRTGWMWRKTESPDECLCNARMAFANLFMHINGEESWVANPWVWVVSFKRIAIGDGDPQAAE